MPPVETERVAADGALIVEAAFGTSALGASTLGAEVGSVLKNLVSIPVSDVFGAGAVGSNICDNFANGSCPSVSGVTRFTGLAVDKAVANVAVFKGCVINGSATSLTTDPTFLAKSSPRISSPTNAF
jgi:hypothetical protein